MITLIQYMKRMDNQDSEKGIRIETEEKEA